jgi:hypothetical protein
MMMMMIIIRSVGKKLRYGLDDRGIEVQFPVRYVSLAETARSSHPTPYAMETSAFFPGDKVTGP